MAGLAPWSCEWLIVTEVTCTVNLAIASEHAILWSLSPGVQSMLTDKLTNRQTNKQTDWHSSLKKRDLWYSFFSLFLHSYLLPIAYTYIGSSLLFLGSLGSSARVAATLLPLLFWYQKVQKVCERYPSLLPVQIKSIFVTMSTLVAAHRDQ